MRSQPKRFVVEVKRGTNRAAFVSPDAAADKFSTAEQALFGRLPQPTSERQDTAAADPSKPKGRVLRSLIEPSPPVFEEPEPPRRGRKPGSKNKPKPAVAVPLQASPPPSVASLSAEARAFAERPPAAPTTVGDGGVGAAEGRPPSAASPEPARARPRLRERSAIIKRYVLGTEPSPGQQRYRKACRAARAAR